MFSSFTEGNKIDLFEPGTLVFFIMAFFADLSLFGFLGLVIPGVGLAIAMFVLMAHWGFGIIILFYFWGKTHGWLPKVILVLFWIVPLPLMLGLALMMLASNKLGAFIIEQAAIQTVAIATAGAGEALEAGAAAAEGAEVVVAAAEGVEAATEVATTAGEIGEVSSATTEVGEVSEVDKAAEGTESAVEGEGGNVDIEPEESKNPMDRLEKDLDQPHEDEFGEQQEAEPVEEEPEKKESDATKKVRDIIDRANQYQDRRDQNDDEDLERAA